MPIRRRPPQINSILPKSTTPAEHNGQTLPPPPPCFGKPVIPKPTTPKPLAAKQEASVTDWVALQAATALAAQASHQRKVIEECKNVRNVEAVNTASQQLEESPQSVEPVASIVDTPKALSNINQSTSISPSLTMGQSTIPVVRQPGHLIVDALAGTGKTFTILEACKKLQGIPTKGITGSEQQEAIWKEIQRGVAPQSIVILAFNSSIAQELKAKTKGIHGVTAMTSHAFGLQQIAKAGIKSKLDIDAKLNKTQMLTEQWMIDFLGDEVEGLHASGKYGNDVYLMVKNEWPTLFQDVERLVELCKLNLIDIDKLPSFEEQHAVVLQFIGQFGIEYDKRLFNPEGEEISEESGNPCLVTMVADVLARSAEDRQYHNFADMVWWPTRLRLDVRKVDLLLVDERQDLNLAQQELAIKGGRRIILVGDIHQAIYGFAGADYKACQRMEERLSATPLGCKVLPLTYTRRCSHAVVELANTYKPTGLQALPEAGQGQILYDHEKTFLARLLPGDMVLCRTNAPLVAHAMRMLKERRKVRIQGREFGEELVGIVNKLDAPNCVIGIRLLAEWHEKQLHKLNSWKFCPEDLKIALNDKWLALMALMESCDSIQEVTDTIEKLFGTRCEKCNRLSKSDVCKKCGHEQDKTGVLFSSIHRAKGLECEHPDSGVWWLRYNKCPHPSAKTIQELEQERNLCYVAITRAKNKLVLVEAIEEDKDKEGEEE